MAPLSALAPLLLGIATLTTGVECCCGTDSYFIFCFSIPFLFTFPHTVRREFIGGKDTHTRHIRPEFPGARDGSPEAQERSGRRKSC